MPLTLLLQQAEIMEVPEAGTGCALFPTFLCVACCCLQPPGLAVLWACAAGLSSCGCVCCRQATHQQRIPHRSSPHGRKRGPLPKVGKVGGGLPGQGRLAPEDCFTPADLRVGSTVNILGRAFLIYDCDAATRAWYQVTACGGGKMGQGADWLGYLLEVQVGLPCALRLCLSGANGATK